MYTPDTYLLKIDSTQSAFRCTADAEPWRGIGEPSCWGRGSIWGWCWGWRSSVLLLSLRVPAISGTSASCWESPATSSARRPAARCGRRCPSPPTRH
ncbi:hypothetical protein DSL92_04000 [Billgrantia gudaonensis]|uniref:Uncharacterized protein n=1 Tax=Billgrantia gudaonensis TaxID=376427 RepID=A0A3S0QG54_9GAMM|nr:hypothetical protein DSL92_04000 [Halomonas gudaonensis]